jgi:anti-sigma regulatory factor (Ser/Thr protein kinase)
MAQDMGDVEYLSITGDIRRQVAPRCLLMPGDASSELVIFGPGVTNVDVVSATAARLRIERHERHHPGAQVSIVPPTAADTVDQYLEMLTPLPSNVVVFGAEVPMGRSRVSLVPATPIADESAAVDAAAFALEACEAARISQTRTNIVALAIAELGSNALRHATGMVDPVVVGATVHGRARTLEVAATDLGQGFSEEKDVHRLLGQIPGASGGSGGLAHLIRLGQKRNVNVTVEVLAGRGRLHWAWNSHRAEPLAYIPGTTVVVRVST